MDVAKLPLAGCRACGDERLEIVLSLGDTPLADRLVGPDHVGQVDPTAPLDLAFCSACTLVQITETVPPEVLFGADYPYFSSVSPSIVAHAREHAVTLVESRLLDSTSLVVEIASNDGYLLRHFIERGIATIGVDPAAGPARAARDIGIDAREDFFGMEIATAMRDAGERPDVIIANNVLAHVADLPGFVQGMALLLKDSGAISIEVPYVVDLVDGSEFDTIYHQHLCYFSVTALDNLFRVNGLSLNRVRQLDIHGGSLRLLVEKKRRPDASVTEMLRAETKKGVDGVGFYRLLAQRAEHVRQALPALLAEIRGRGGRLVGYGAAAKATTLLSYCDIGVDTLDYIVDLSPHKHGKLMPGCRIPIVPTERLLEDQPEHVVLLAWNFAEEILAQQLEYQRRGGRFVVPIPSPVVLPARVPV